jgi:hypothetical protein
LRPALLRPDWTRTMFLKSATLPFAAATITLMSGPASAQTSPIRTFRSIEFEADPSAMVDGVRTDLATRISPGSPVTNARTFLRAAGAHCRKPNAAGRVRCRYSDLHIQDDIMQDVSWTVDLSTADDKVMSFTVVREPATD